MDKKYFLNIMINLQLIERQCTVDVDKLKVIDSKLEYLRSEMTKIVDISSEKDEFQDDFHNLQIR